ncbi:MAG: hypothetical protein HeimC3_01660 [Candidatus Heimdallarchaeota archaeon LC_3]|nr:MAG: hypothetical protein HeimC3_01660 [Candidatus Heimdallarchaeota archaeon LC_3]
MVSYFLKKASEIQPSQLYLNAAKISKVKELYKPISLDSLPPIPIKELDNEIIFTDGHHRAYVAVSMGLKDLPVYWETENNLSWNLYKVCVNWCKSENIYEILDLRKKIVKNTDFKNLWIKKCTDLRKEMNL